MFVYLCAIVRLCVCVRMFAVIMCMIVHWQCLTLERAALSATETHNIVGPGIAVRNGPRAAEEDGGTAPQKKCKNCSGEPPPPPRRSTYHWVAPCQHQTVLSEPASNAAAAVVVRFDENVPNL